MCISSWWQNGCCLTKPHSNIPVSPTNLTEGAGWSEGRGPPRWWEEKAWVGSEKYISCWGCCEWKEEVKSKGRSQGLDHRGLEVQLRESCPHPAPKKDLFCSCILIVMAHVCTEPTSPGCSSFLALAHLPGTELLGGEDCSRLHLTSEKAEQRADSPRSHQEEVAPRLSGFRAQALSLYPTRPQKHLWVAGAWNRSSPRLHPLTSSSILLDPQGGTPPLPAR